MRKRCDLHSHSPHAGGTGKTGLEEYVAALATKGLDYFGTGDCLQPDWLAHLEQRLYYDNDAYTLKGSQTAVRFILQTEIILTTPLRDRRKKTHLLILFPHLQSCYKAYELFREKWGVKTNIGRPFFKASTIDEASDFLFSLKAIDKYIEIIPAHIFTPDGIYGGDDEIVAMRNVIGDFASEINAVETGLSADPSTLSRVPELADLAWISNSDAHSCHMNKLGREFFEVEMAAEGYRGIIDAIRARKIAYTAEFNPQEGKYFLSGHRKGKEGHSSDHYTYSVDSEICPECKKRFTPGVNQRSFRLGKLQEIFGVTPLNPTGDKIERRYFHHIPLVEVIGYALKIKSPQSVRVNEAYLKILKQFPDEISIYSMSYSEVEERLLRVEGLQSEIVGNILKVKEERFSFDPPGFDGVYGRLRID